MSTYSVPYGYNVQIEITRDVVNDDATVKILAPMYMRKEYQLTFCWKASQFSDYEILKDHDLVSVLTQAYGKN